MVDSPARKDRLVQFIHEVWDCGRADAVERYLAPSYTLHHDPGDPWDGRVLDLDDYKDRLRRSRAPFPDQTFEIAGRGTPRQRSTQAGRLHFPRSTAP